MDIDKEVEQIQEIEKELCIDDIIIELREVSERIESVGGFTMFPILDRKDAKELKIFNTARMISKTGSPTSGVIKISNTNVAALIHYIADMIG